jgi:hypothetical protein
MFPSAVLKSPDAPGGSTASVAEALRHSPIPALRKLSVEESSAGIVITGRVSSYYLKQLAQETVMPLLDQRALVNQVRVERV